MNSRLLMTLEVLIGTPERIGDTAHGTRVIVPVIGGRFEGPKLRGKVRGGADWTLLRHGPAEVIAALGRGDSVDPATYYFRTTPRFETSDPKYQFLNKLLAVSTGDRKATGPIYTIDEIL